MPRRFDPFAPPCEACAGSGRAYHDGTRVWMPCEACNELAPPYPGLVPDGASERAYRSASFAGRSGRRLLQERLDRGARAFWQGYAMLTAAERSSGVWWPGFGPDDACRWPRPDAAADSLLDAAGGG